MKKDLNKIAYVEKAIAKKFGKEAIVNPKSNWTDEKEEEYLEDLYIWIIIISFVIIYFDFASPFDSIFIL